MIVRLLIAVFSSVVSGVCYISGMLRLMSGLLLGFGVFTALFFGVIFLLPASDDRLWFPIYGTGSSWPFFLIAAILAGMIIWLFVKKTNPGISEPLSRRHFKYLGGGLFLYLCALFIPAFLWFPSEEKRLISDVASLGTEVFLGVCLYLIGSGVALYLFYHASKGSTVSHPDLMRRFVPAIFSFFHLDKMPALVAYLLVYSPETRVIFPKVAALALAGYVAIGYFLAKVCSDSSIDEL
jgi:hypothetical protein